ncbi:unnamed protein product [Ambrosiozyma monospora]|uniref:Unnamed protein product n=1 Tax=Ambrosiozyma monospora TaxID=43982 RepID=A0ACB5TVS2_AMBMO|nr:unnamed protein product [Ambrosiozyma monospora]
MIDHIHKTDHNRSTANSISFGTNVSSEINTFCGTCGFKGHSRTDPSCPKYGLRKLLRIPQDVYCEACGLKGHFWQDSNCPVYGLRGTTRQHMINHIHKSEHNRTVSNSTSSGATTTSFIDSDSNGSRNLNDTQQNNDLSKSNILSQSPTPSTATTISSVLPPYSPSQSSVSVSSSPKYRSLSRSQISPPSQSQNLHPSQTQQQKSPPQTQLPQQAQSSHLQQQKQSPLIQQQKQTPQEQQQKQTSQQQHNQQTKSVTTNIATATHELLPSSLPPRPLNINILKIPTGPRNLKLVSEEISKVVKPPRPHIRRPARTLAKFVKQSTTKDKITVSDLNVSFINSTSTFNSTPNPSSNSKTTSNQDVTKGEKIVKDELSIPDEFSPVGSTKAGIDIIFVHEDVPHGLRPDIGQMSKRPLRLAVMIVTVIATVVMRVAQKKNKKKTKMTPLLIQFKGKRRSVKTITAIMKKIIMMSVRT